MLVADGRDGANVFAHHAGNVAGPVDGNGVKGADETCPLRADGNASTAIDTSVPADLKNDGFSFLHKLNLLVFRIRAKVARHGIIQLFVLPGDVLRTEDIGLFVVEFPHFVAQFFQPLILVAF